MINVPKAGVLPVCAALLAALVLPALPARGSDVTAPRIAQAIGAVSAAVATAQPAIDPRSAAPQRRLPELRAQQGAPPPFTGPQPPPAPAPVATGAAAPKTEPPVAGSAQRETEQPPDETGYMASFRAIAAVAGVRMHAAVVTIPDPIATRLGRSFDLEVAALISAFEVRDYVLDGFWLNWPVAAAEGKASEDKQSPTDPSALLFRRDVWRRCLDPAHQADAGCVGAPSVEYYVLLLVGEAPTFGVYPQAFAAAARDAVTLESMTGPAANADAPGAQHRAGTPPRPAEAAIELNVIGPSFSGSMQSLMGAVDTAAGDAGACPESASASADDNNCPKPQRFHARIVSPSATVTSNRLVDAKANSGDANKSLFPHIHSNLDVTYRTMAADQCKQLQALFDFLSSEHGIKPGQIAILAEESSFGLGRSECAARAGEGQGQPTVLQFPQNIASIRAEHAKVAKAERNAVDSFSTPSKFLELDMTGVEVGKDLPPPYEPDLSTRSDELVLYQMLDALATWTRPAVTVIIATDIRDRLFLLNEVKSALPGTLTVVLESDNLMVHPDYRQLSRGSIVVGAGDSLVCLDYDPTGRKEIACRREAQQDPELPGQNDNKAAASPAPAAANVCPSKQVVHDNVPRQYFPFATDYAANMFRAALWLTAPASSRPPADNSSDCPQLMVATLAGFQAIESTQHTHIPHNSVTLGLMLGSENHANLWHVAMPVFTITMFCFVLIAGWIWRDPTGIRTLLPLSRHAVRALGTNLSVLAHKLFRRNLDHTFVKANSEILGPEPDREAGRLIRAGMAALMVVAAVGFALAASRTLLPGPYAEIGMMFLIHGRDQVSLIIVASLVAGIVLISGLRVLVWNEHCRKFAAAEGVPPTLVLRLLEGGHFRSLLATAALMFALAASVDTWFVTTVDPLLLPGLLGFAALGAGAYFLVQLLFQLMRLQWLGRELARGLPKIRAQIGESEWPSPLLLRQSPTNPLNLVLHLDDVGCLRSCDVEAWVKKTFLVLKGEAVFDVGKEPQVFQAWQGYLVAQMKAGASALRGCAWAAIVAPIGALVMLEVHPNPFERAQTLAAIALMATSLFAVLLTTVRLEKDILFGRMFTRDEDRVSLAETFAAMLPKLIVVLVALASMFAPDLLTWIPSLTKALGAAH